MGPGRDQGLENQKAFRSGRQRNANRRVDSRFHRLRDKLRRDASGKADTNLWSPALCPCIGSYLDQPPDRTAPESHWLLPCAGRSPARKPRDRDPRPCPGLVLPGAGSPHSPPLQPHCFPGAAQCLMSTRGSPDHGMTLVADVSGQHVQVY